LLEASGLDLEHLCLSLKADGDEFALGDVSKVLEDFHIDGIPPPFAVVDKLSGESRYIRHNASLGEFGCEGLSGVWGRSKN
jgi:hypothetical protein